MPRNRKDGFAWRGVALVALTYSYFLIFAQFAFLKRLALLGIADAHLKAVMGAMALGGIVASLIAPRVHPRDSASARLRAAFEVCGAAAWLTLLPLGFAGALGIALAIGVGVGLLTVTLATHLKDLAGGRNPLLAAGLGTGAAYLVCNFPPFFTASPEIQCWCAGLFCIAGAGATLLPRRTAVAEQEERQQASIGWALALAGFTALVWMDSAAFFIIQNTPALKAGTWEGTLHLWVNGALHLAAALGAVWLLKRKSMSTVLVAAFAMLGFACILLLNPEHALTASLFYPVGVSLYSVALVAYPSLLSPTASLVERGKAAGWIYAVAGWMGSAMGIGMAQNLHRIPPAFVIAAGTVVVTPELIRVIRLRTREFVVTAVVLFGAFVVGRIPRPVQASPQLSPVEHGRQVYISEGCIHCHSQYVRPNSPDELMWGPVESIDELRLQNPPLIGNRRQGPDLAEVGLRRSPLWLKAHFFNPAEVSGASIMPEFGFLFHDSPGYDDPRGDDLVAYLESLHGVLNGAGAHLAEENAWQPAPAALAKASAAEGERLYRQDCATCHSADGRTRLAWRASFKRQPEEFARGEISGAMRFESPQQRLLQLARITKFGIPGTDMPGHEYLADDDIASISLWLSQVIAQSNPKP